MALQFSSSLFVRSRRGSSTTGVLCSRSFFAILAKNHPPYDDPQCWFRTTTTTTRSSSLCGCGPSSSLIRSFSTTSNTGSGGSSSKETNDPKSSSKRSTKTTTTTTGSISQKKRFQTLKTNNSTPPIMDIVYVHPLSQIVLSHFQQHYHHWLIQYQIDRQLCIHRDGTFQLVFCREGGRIWTSYDTHEKKHWLSVTLPSFHQAAATSSTTTTITDSNSSTPTVAIIQHRFMLQDNLMPAWHNQQQPLSVRIGQTVDELVQLVDQQFRKHPNCYYVIHK